MTEGNAPETYSRRNGKSAAAFRTISEVASELDAPSHVLRFWETKFSQVRPLKRGGGRRYYRPEDISLLRKIRGLLYDDGYTIKGVQKLLREGGAKSDILKDAAAADRSANSRDGVLTRAQRSALEEIMGELKALRELADKS